MPIGSNFDDFLKVEGIYKVTTASAVKKVQALQKQEGIKAQPLTKTATIKRVQNSPTARNQRSVVCRK
jgi:hypothetical protein